MTTVLIVYGSRHGGTGGIAERIGDVLRTEGLDVRMAEAGHITDIGTPDAFVVGSGVYMGSWLKEPLEFVERNKAVLASRPTWFFSSGPLTGSTASKDADDPMTAALGPEEGPGSGGRRKVAELSAATHARENRVFYGAFDTEDPPRTMSERLIRMMPGSKNLLPRGDFRDWVAIAAWAREIAAALATDPVPA